MSTSTPVARRLHRAHRRTRSKGSSPALYALARMVLAPLIYLWLRLSIKGQQQVPQQGAVLLAPNHLSFLDAFVVALSTRRRVYFVAKQEFFHKAWQAWLFSRLGAFPIQRGLSDQEAIETARQVLLKEEVLVMFPEGTRVRDGFLGQPKKGAARLALETGAQLIPVAVHGTDKVRRGGMIYPAKVKVRVGKPIQVEHRDQADTTTASFLTEASWAQTEQMFKQLGGRVREVPVPQVRVKVPASH